MTLHTLIAKGNEVVLVKFENRMGMKRFDRVNFQSIFPASSLAVWVLFDILLADLGPLAAPR